MLEHKLVLKSPLDLSLKSECLACGLRMLVNANACSCDRQHKSQNDKSLTATRQTTDQMFD